MGRENPQTVLALQREDISLEDGLLAEVPYRYRRAGICSQMSDLCSAQHSPEAMTHKPWCVSMLRLIVVKKYETYLRWKPSR